MNIKKNLIFNTLYQILNIVVPLITAPHLARTVGAEGTGVYAYYNSIAYYFVMFTMLGLNNYGNRTIARVRENKNELSKTFWNIYYVQMITGILSLMIYMFYIANFVNKHYVVVASLNIFYVISAMFDISWFFSGLEMFKLIVTRNAIVKFLSLIGIICFVKTKDDLPIYVFIMTIGILISQLSVWPFLKKQVEWVSPKLDLMKIHIKPNLILFIPVIAVSLYKIMDKIMIGLLSTKIQVGYYENSEKIINIPQALINSLGTVMLPRMSNILAQKKQDIAKQYMRDSMQYAMFLACGSVFGIIGVSDNFVEWFLGNDFKECGVLLAFLAPTILFNTWANIIRTQYLIPLNKDKNYIFSVGMGAIVNLFINGLMIKKHGAFGAVIGTILAEFTVMIIQTLEVRKDIEVRRYLKDNIIFLIAGMFMCIVVRNLANIGMDNFGTLALQLIVGVVVYLLLGIVLMRITNYERLLYIIGKLKIKNIV